MEDELILLKLLRLSIFKIELYKNIYPILIYIFLVLNFMKGFHVSL